MKRSKNLQWRIVIALAITAGVILVPHLIINGQRFQQWGLQTLNQHSSWKIGWKNLNMKLLLLEFSAEGITLDREEKQQHIKIASVYLKFSPWRLLRGQLALTQLKMDSPEIQLSELPDEKNKPARLFPPLNLKRIFLVQNLRIKNISVNDLKIALPQDQILRVRHGTAKLSPTLRGTMELEMNLSDVTLETKDRTPITLQNLQTKMTTDLTQWTPHPPYINDAQGTLTMQELRATTIPFSRIFGQATYQNKELHLKRMEIQSGSNALQGALNVDFKSEKFSADIDIPKPLSIPNFGSDEQPVFLTGGNLIGKIHLEGTGFGPATTEGMGEVHLTHTWTIAPQSPAQADITARWSHGLLQFEKTQITTDNQALALSGQLHLAPLNFNLAVHATQFPLERVFEKFGNPHFHPIFGEAAIDGTLTGWGDSFHLALKGVVDKPGYTPLQTEKAAVDFDLTLPQLHLIGTILSEEKPTGHAELTIHYGPKIPGQHRNKELTLKSSLTEQPLATTLPQIPCAGAVSGTFDLKGNPESPQGEGSLQVAQGNCFGTPLNLTQGTFALENKNRLTLKTAQWEFADGTDLTFSEPVIFDFISNTVRIHGKPTANLDLDLSYESSSHRTTVERFIYTDPENPSRQTDLSGHWIVGGDWNLNVKGILDISRLKPLLFALREAEGPVKMDFTLSGTTQNPALQGSLAFQNNTISLHGLSYNVESLNGTVQMNQHTIQMKQLEGISNFGSFVLNGSLQHANRTPTAYDLNLKANQLQYRNPQGAFRIEFDGDLTLKGPASHPLLAGTLNLLNAKYTKQFDLIDEFRQKRGTPAKSGQSIFSGPPIQLQLRVTNGGDVTIDNNIGKISLSTDILLSGTTETPKVAGTIEVTEGKIHYLGFDFDITRGFMEFRAPTTSPYLEIQAEREVELYQLTLLLHGRTNNLTLDLSGSSRDSGALDKRDVISLLTFGITAKEREQTQFFQNQLGPNLVAERLSAAVSPLVTRTTHLDTFQLESNTDTTTGGQFSRFHVGKRFSDRFTVEFLSDLHTDVAIQTLRAEYWMTDFLLFKGSRGTDQSFELDLGLRFRTR